VPQFHTNRNVFSSRLNWPFSMCGWSSGKLFQQPRHVLTGHYKCRRP